MSRRLAAMAACGMLALAAAGCEGGSARSLPSHSHNGARTGAAALRPQSATLVLPPGRSSAQYKITAPSPAQYGFDVIIAAPASANASVTARTWYGAVLGILSSTRDPDWCRRRGSGESCFEPFPLLPAQRAGTWTIIASKRSAAAATVRITVIFAKP